MIVAAPVRAGRRIAAGAAVATVLVLMASGCAASDGAEAPWPSPSDGVLGSPSSFATPSGGSRTLSPTAFGAVGDGRHDDTEALQRALDALRPGDTLVLPAGRTFAHAGVVRMRVPGSHLAGGATVLATAEATSAVAIDADGATVSGLTIVATGVTRRWDTPEQMGLLLEPRSGITVTGVTVRGSAAAGIYVQGAHEFALRDVTVADTAADGIHITGGAHDGTVVRATVTGSGDDGIAVVSYRKDAETCRRLTFVSPRVVAQRWGRAFSVVGGEDITWRDVRADRSSAASIYVAAEGEFATRGVRGVLFDGGLLVDANTSDQIDHGAVMLYNSQPGSPTVDVTVRDITIRGTRESASASVRIVSQGGEQSHLTLLRLTLWGGPPRALATNVPGDTYRAVGWTRDGIALADPTASG